MAKRIDKRLSFFLDEFGETVVIDGKEKKALICDVQDKLTYYDDKIIRASFEIQTGDLIEYQQKQWLLISEVDRDRKSNRARMRRCNQRITIRKQSAPIIIGYDPLGRPIYEYSEPTHLEIPAIVENNTFHLATNQPIIQAENEIMVMVKWVEGLRDDLSVGESLFLLNKQYRILGADEVRNGLLTLKCDLNI